MAAEHVALSMEGTVVNATPWRRFSADVKSARFGRVNEQPVA